MSQFNTNRGWLRSAAALAFVAGFAVNAQAGECPADLFKPNARQAVDFKPVGVTDTTLGAIDLGKEMAKISGRELRFHNSNALIGRQPDTSGLKSGYTSQAGNCLIATADRDGHQVLLVLLGAPDRWWEAAGIIARGLAVAAPGPRLD